jgi:MarR family transcriptional regulator, organic hydroperoxide resistance regulator
VTLRRSSPQPAIATAADPFWGTLIELLLGMRGWWTALCEELGLTPSQGLALRRLDPERPLAMSTLAEALACDASNVTGIVDKLETRGLIARRGADHDRRVKTLVVTERGCALRNRLIARLLEAPPAVRALSADVKAVLTATLRAVLEDRAEDRNLVRAPARGPASAPTGLTDRRRPTRTSRG